MKNTSYLFFIAVLFSSCFGLHTGHFTSSAVITGNNYRVVAKGATGTAHTTIVLGIGGLVRNAQVAEAKADLLQKYNVKDNQQLVNVSVDWKTVTTPFYFVVITRKCTVTADIIEFTEK